MTTDWRDNLREFFEETEDEQPDQGGKEFPRFIGEVAVPAFRELAGELEKHGRTATIRNSVTSAALIVQRAGEEEMTYRIQGRTFPDRTLPYAEIRFRERRGLRLIRVESMFRSGEEDYRLEDITKEEVIRDFLDNYVRRVEKT